MSECGRELLLVSPGAGGKDPWRGWCFKTEDAVLLSSSSSSSEADPINESETKTPSCNLRLFKEPFKASFIKPVACDFFQFLISRNTILKSMFGFFFTISVDSETRPSKYFALCNRIVKI